MMTYLLVGAGGALGAMGRHFCSEFIDSHVHSFPLGTLFVNVMGSFLIGVITAFVISRGGFQNWRLFLVTGFLGGFTTFSSFSLATVRLMQNGLFFSAILNVLANVALCLLMTGIGFYFVLGTLR
ncbi:fluoride efflux transporter CrcB [Succinimonas amylolytica]|jgi:CrcB protein|uniref:fluoride efflux transporter CrcB n=1 Tax=Succinimonas amylolytica TaxID=83769 RepID=UPI0003825C93|nr:fluoride efflux transporter CrcB [Succinimonas amylolytica]